MYEKTMKLSQIGITALLVLLCFGGVSAIEMVDFVVYIQPSSPDAGDTTDFDVLLGEISESTGVQDVATFLSGSTILRTCYLELP